EYCNALTETVSLDIYLMNGQKISLMIVSTDSTDDVLEAIMTDINLSDELVHYFALFLIKREEDGEASMYCIVFVVYCIVLYNCIVLYCIVLYNCICSVLYCIVLYNCSCIVLYNCSVVYCIVLYCIVIVVVLYCIVLYNYCIVLYCTIVVYCIVLYCTIVLYCIVLYNCIVLYCIVQLVRKLQDYESPYLSMQKLKGTYRIAVRKNFWDSKIEDKILDNKIGMNLLYVQAVSDIERGWVIGPKEAYSRLAELKQSGSKKEYLRLARMMKYYGFIQFKPCVTNYPEDNTRVLVSCGDRELNFRLQTSDNKIQEGSFKVTRMRCWRITSSNVTSEEDNNTEESMELAFEYLLSKETLHWITVYSEQAILISMCLQSMVDEILRLKLGKAVKSIK
ncbi:hypothetical protein QZH41_009634, partial [Actinostola sp. cb2023]